MSLNTPPRTMLPRTPLLRWLAVALLITLAFFYNARFRTSPITKTTSKTTSVTAILENIPHPKALDKKDDLTWVKEVLRKNEIGPDISYASRAIRYIPDAPDRKLLSEVDHALFPQHFQDIDIRFTSSVPMIGPLEVHVKKSARPDAVDASDLIFGASTTYERFFNEETSPVAEWSRWLTDGQGHSNGGGLVLSLFNTTEIKVQKTAEALAAAGINATVVQSDPSLDMPGRYVALVKLLYDHPTRDTRKYFVLIDDDTFFPAMTELQRVLTRYDPNKPYYIGTLTERHTWMLSHKAVFAFGGGGVFLTKQVAQKISQLPCLAKKEDGKYVLDIDQGDRLLYNCLTNYTDLTLSYLPQLHQLDPWGDLSGFYESGQQPLSLHHYKSWHHFIPEKMHYIADACGEDCVLQRFQFKDNFILSNGYSIAEYPKGIDFDVFSIEDTFENNDENESNEPLGDDINMVLSLGSMRKTLTHTGRKRSWELLDSRREGDGRVKQVYLKRRGDGRWQPEGEPHAPCDSIAI